MQDTAQNSWLLLRSGPSEATWNMALDAALLETAPTLGKPVLRFYGWTQPAASFGYFQKFSEIERLTSLRPLVRRPTGGGLVPHDADWTYSIAFPPMSAWYLLKAAESYERVHRWIQAAFKKLAVASELAPGQQKSLPGQCFVGHEKSDLLWHGRKIAGAAQRRTRSGLLIQGSVQAPPIKINRADWEDAMIAAAQTEQGVAWVDLEMTGELARHATDLADKTYSREDYNRRR